MRICTLPGCGREHNALGLCSAHYYRKRHGKPNWDSPIRPQVKTMREYVDLRIEKTGTCWLWTTNIRKDGYGLATHEHQKPRLAHRAVWELERGPIPDGMELDHDPTCPKHCVNPDHLTLRTKSEHTAIGWERGELDGGWGEKSGYARLSTTPEEN